MKKLFALLLFLIQFLPSYSQVLFEDNFDSGTFKPEWSFETNIYGDNGLIEIENGVGVNNSFGVKIGKSQNSTMLTSNGLNLHLDLTGQTNLILTFMISKYHDDTNIDDGIFLSDDGGANFTLAQNFNPDEWCNNTFGKHPPVDILKLAAEKGLTPNDSFVIQFRQTGQKDFSGVGDGFFLDNVRVFNPELVYSSLPFSDDFNSGTFKKSWQQRIAYGSAIPGRSITNPMGLVEVENQSGVDGTPGVRMGRICNSSGTPIYVTNALDLHLNLDSVQNADLTFWIAKYWDDNHVDDGIYFSDDGGNNFTKVLNLLPEEWCPNTFGQHPPVDIDALADFYGLNLTAEFVIRFQQTGDKDFTGVGDGFFLDNVQVYEPNQVYASLPFSDDFNTGAWSNSWAWKTAEKTNLVASPDAITNPMSVVEVENLIGVDESPAIKMGRICDGTFTTNALDLHLNLLNQTNVQMTVMIADAADDTDLSDGVFFSNDGGESFTPVPVFAFDFSNTPNNEFILYTIDVSTLAANAGLELTETFVIRFQQRGADDFSGTNSSRDGIIIDNVNVGMITPVNQQNQLASIHVYPNPSTNYLNIRMDANTNWANSTITIKDGLGRALISTYVESNFKTLDISALNAGVYFISILSPGQNMGSQMKFIKN
jgi:hypothetical protein